MKPPICEICNLRFDPSEGALVSFVDDSRSRAFAERALAEPGFVGHRPNTGWFCGGHSEGARALSSGTRGEALAALRSSLADPDPDPDANGNGLRVPPVFRRQRSTDAETGLVEVNRPVDVDVFELHERLRVFRPALLAALGLPDEVALETRTKRTWNPMDGAREPDCPYSDRVTDEGKVDGLEQVVELDSNWWSRHSLSNASARLDIMRRPSPNEWATRICSISGSTAHLRRGEEPVVQTLRVKHPDDPAVEQLIAGFAAGLSPDTSAS